MALPIALDQGLIDSIATEFQLRDPNKRALRKLIYHLTGDFNPLEPMVMHMATGAGKTYLMAALIEYLSRFGVKNVMVVVPPSTVLENKTVQNFTQGSRRYVDGFSSAPQVVSPGNYGAWRSGQSELFRNAADGPMVYVFNVSQLIEPKKVNARAGTEEGMRRKIRDHQEESGSLYDYLVNLDDLVVIADESHLFGTSAKAFNQALKDLRPAATIGLTASASDTDHVIFHYPLYSAIEDGYVKSPMLVYRENGYPKDSAEERQLLDAVSLLRNKEAAYEAYGQANFPGEAGEKKRTKPLLFVVCESVAHAGEVTKILQGPGYFGDPDAVLQFDNKHNDAVTLSRLDELDSPASTVRAIVSVDRLKEGWDTKRVAVMCALRAMSSDILTQQTMGRGLRLPFGARTGVAELDQLDILSHKSFKSLLKDEDVLRSFGLGDAAQGAISGMDVEESFRQGEGQVQPNPNGLSSEAETSSGSGSTAWPDTPTAEATDGASDIGTKAGETTQVTGGNAGGVSFRRVGDNETMQRADYIPATEIRVNEHFAGKTFLFPSAVMAKSTTPFLLTHIHEEDIIRAARRVADSKEALTREEIVVRRSKLDTKRTTDAEVESAPVAEDDVIGELTRRVFGLGVVTQDKKNAITLAQYVLPTFMANAGIDHWTEKAKQSAVDELVALVNDKAQQHASSLQTETTIVPVELPIDEVVTLPFGKEVLQQLSKDQQAKFKPREFYDGWNRGLFPAASFDSWGGEYLLALLLNYTSDIVWWKRLYSTDGASIMYTTRDTYYPDFVAQDSDGTMWIIEGKSDKGRDDETVQAKRAAARVLVRELLGEEDFVGQKWGYVIAYESDIRASESWEDLKRKSNPGA
ncbi:Type III restriction enzyme, res subunit [Corynebacterium afermentans subsp. afermentans]|uniref:Type III restriction enzyme n=1 Tax=Corynebacterium afermentans TaxID=38286 RepID=A0A9X8R5X9_9CORY|nr:DEAD/DEAH box helicase family protein [Corynebacterium afermentans]OAA16968.1 restriction endonuclease [Corynebacterium afermentans subsp. afermentans]WJY56658.1 Type III restriction enzyme, res subunit [Corynebacterium afermentans subsp. afermentans]SIQ51927.1 type III restriction enzyme [Corynebacterium afermentans]